MIKFILFIAILLASVIIFANHNASEKRALYKNLCRQSKRRISITLRSLTGL